MNLPPRTEGGAMRVGHRGVTFIEMMVVLVLLGLVIAMASPKIDVTKYQIESAMQGVGMTLLAVERQAITQQHDVIVMFDQTNQVMRIHDDANNNGLVDAGERVRAVALGENIVFGQGAAPAMPMGPGPITFKKTIGGLPAVVFHRDGSASEAGGFYLISKRSLNSGTHVEDARAVTIDRATGRASWWRYGPPTWRRAF